jgi:hypothetical protein
VSGGEVFEDKSLEWPLPCVPIVNAFIRKVKKVQKEYTSDDIASPGRIEALGDIALSLQRFSFFLSFQFSFVLNSSELYSEHAP